MPKFLVTIDTDHPQFADLGLSIDSMKAALTGEFGYLRDTATVSEPKCETCSHWTPTGWPNNASYCKKLEEKTELTEVYGDYGYGVTILTAPDFFCALWEGK